LLPAIYVAVRINHYSKRIFVIKVAIFVTNGSHHVPTTKSTLFMMNKDEWDIKEGCGKSMKNALHVSMAKGTSQH